MESRALQQEHSEEPEVESKVALGEVGSEALHRGSAWRKLPEKILQYL